MNNEIGKENLPNCYIKNIEITNLNRTQNLITVSVFTKDMSDKESRYWYDNESVYKYLNVLIALSTDQNISNALTNGAMPLDKKKIMRRFRRNSGIMFDSKKVKSHTFRSTQGDYEIFEYVFKFKINKNKNNVVLFCCTSLDVQEYSIQNNIDLSNYRVNTYTGPVASEILFNNGDIPNRTNVFINEQGQVHSGAVHNHRGVFMEGSYHSSEPHGILRQRSVTDSKIKDYREVESLFSIDRRALNAINRAKLVDGPWMSHNDDGDLYGIFSINTRKLLATKTLYGAKLAKLSPHVFDRLLQNFNFRSLSLYQEKIQPTVTSKRGTPRISRRKLLRKKFLVHTRDVNSNLRSRTFRGTTIKENRISRNLENRTIMFKQEHSNRFKGVYKYGLLIQFIDPTYNFVQEFLSELKESILQLKPYLVRSKRNSSVVKNTQRFTEKFINTELSRFPNQETAPWSFAIKNYVDLYTAIKGLDKEQSNDLLHKVTLQAHPKYATPRSLNNFYDSFVKLQSELIKYFSIKVRTTSNSAGRSTNRSPKNRVTMVIPFTDTVSFEDKDKNLSFFDEKTDGIPMLTKQQLLSNSKKEFSKFFKSKPNFSRTQIASLGTQELSAMSDIDNYLVSYMTPKKIKIKNEVTLLNRRPKNLKKQKINDGIKKLKSAKKKERVQRKKKKISKLSVKKAKPMTKYLDKKVKRNKSTKQNLGKNTKFRLAENKTKLTKIKRISKKVKNKFEIKKKGKQKIRRNNFKISNKTVEKIISNPRKAKKLPVSIKSIIGSRSSSVRNNIFRAKKDPIASNKSYQMFKLMFTNIMQIKFYQNNRWHDLNLDRLEKLRDIVLCKLVPYNIQGLTEQEEDINVSNKYFLLKINNVRVFNRYIDTVTLQDVSSKIDELPRIKDEYYTNNPVKQSKNRLGTNNVTKMDRLSTTRQRTRTTTRRTPRRTSRRRPVTTRTPGGSRRGY